VTSPVCSSAPACGPAEQGFAADCLQRPLRSRFRQQLTPGVRRLKEHVFHIGTRFIMNTLILEDGTPKRRHRARLNDLLATTKGIVRIASAYVTDRELLSDVGGRDTRLLISLLPMDIASGAMSLETLRWMLELGCRNSRAS
jgi:hypothetical protein